MDLLKLLAFGFFFSIRHGYACPASGFGFRRFDAGEEVLTFRDGQDRLPHPRFCARGLAPGRGSRFVRARNLVVDGPGHRDRRRRDSDVG